MDWYRIFAVCGVIGPLLCACGDLLLDLKGPDNQKLGKYGIMDSAWDHMDVRRFVWSILLAAAGVPLAGLGFVAMSHVLAGANPGFGLAFFLFSFVGTAGGFFIHCFICLLPILYKKVAPTHGFAHAEACINTLYEAVKVPFWLYYLSLVLVPSVLVIWALCAGYLPLSRWFILLSPPVVFLVGILLAKLFPRACCDFPFCITPSLGLSMINLMALLAL